MNKRARHKDQSGVSGVSTLQEQSVGGVGVVEQSGGIESLGTFQLQTPLTYAFMAKSQAGLIATCKDTDNDPPVAVFLRVSELTQISANVSSQLILNPAAFAASPIWRVLPSTPTSIAADIIRYNCSQCRRRPARQHYQHNRAKHASWGLLYRWSMYSVGL